MYKEIREDSPEAAVVAKLWNACVGEEGFCYVALTPRQIEEKLLREQKKGAEWADRDIHKLVLLHEGGDAFVAGTYVVGDRHAYVTMVMVEASSRLQGIGRDMLLEFEGRMKERFGVEEMRIVFFNPVTLTWEVPGHPGCEHPNSPGVDTASGAYPFFLKCGYEGFATQNSYFMQLKGYEFPQAIQKAEERLAQDGYYIKKYDPETMYGMEEMLQKLGNSMWLRDILGEKPPKEGGRPILVPVKEGRVLGFTGPLDREPNGRGFFAGIAVDEAARGHGVAKTLFAHLCRGLQEIGAGYMTLFTGVNNPARRIYEAAGFTVARQWEDMKKKL